MEKKIKYMITILVLIGFLFGINGTSITAINTMDERTDLHFFEIDQNEQKFEMELNIEDISLKHLHKPLGQPFFVYPGSQVHPAIANTINGQSIQVYKDNEIENIIWTFEPDDGVFYDVGGDYPTVKLWDDTRFFASFVPDYFDSQGGIVYLFETTDPTNFDTYDLVGWDWSDNGFTNFNDLEMACDGSKENWEWGFISLVGDTSYGEGVSEGPFVTYQTSEDGYAQISWYLIEGCAHTDNIIDEITKKAYSVYDVKNSDTSGKWGLFIRMDYYNDWEQEGIGYVYTGSGNMEYPSISANNGNLLIVAETDDEGNKDLICMYGSELDDLETSIVVSTDYDERYPELMHIEGDTYICTFIKNNALFMTRTYDAGITWSEPINIIEDTSEEVFSEYKAVDISNFAYEIFYEVGDISELDIWMYSTEWDIKTPKIEILQVSGGIGTSAVITNTGEADAEDVDFSISITGGILGKVDVLKQEFHDIAIGDEVTISSGIFLGIGPIEIEISADDAQEQISGIQLIFYTLI